MARFIPIPNSDRVQVFYTRDGVNYVANIPRPVSQSALQLTMLTRKVGISQITGIKPAKSYAR